LLDLTPKKYDICISIVVVNAGDTGKKAQVWKSTNFDAGLYDITGFLWALIISMYLQFLDLRRTTICGTYRIQGCIKNQPAVKRLGSQMGEKR
jgi:hypothetical protein